MLDKTSEFFTEFNTAYYDEHSDKIMNCREGSFTWWHERGHQLDMPKRIKTRSFETMALTFTILASAIENTQQAVIWAGLWISVIMFWELSAWYYAIRNYVFKKKEGDSSGLRQEDRSRQSVNVIKLEGV